MGVTPNSPSRRQAEINRPPALPSGNLRPIPLQRRRPRRAQRCARLRGSAGNPFIIRWPANGRPADEVSADVCRRAGARSGERRITGAIVAPRQPWVLRCTPPTRGGHRRPAGTAWRWVRRSRSRPPWVEKLWKTAGRGSVDQEKKVLAPPAPSCQGLVEHGWSYIQTSTIPGRARAGPRMRAAPRTRNFPT